MRGSQKAGLFWRFRGSCPMDLPFRPLLGPTLQTRFLPVFSIVDPSANALQGKSFPDSL
ncbi:hypothetical protein IE4803_PB00191 (plasmid) [Rhizobium etli bv. phaseoli str. IE4803]|nr:hypothetical protein IE4803_PB00191 [Rhizobium etli bv. phaseoli str. IE4803]